MTLPKIRWYAKTFKEKNKWLISFWFGDEKILVKYQIIWNKIEDLKIIELKVSLVFDDRYIKTKIRRYGY